MSEAKDESSAEGATSNDVLEISASKRYKLWHALTAAKTLLHGVAQPSEESAFVAGYEQAVIDCIEITSSYGEWHKDYPREAYVDEMSKLISNAYNKRHADTLT